jgi:hypothetical protein
MVCLLCLGLCVACAKPRKPEAPPAVVVVVPGLDAELQTAESMAEPEEERDPELRSLADCATRLRRNPVAPGGALRERYLFALDAEGRGDFVIAREAYHWVVKHASAGSPYVSLSFLGMATMYESGGQLGIARRLLGKAVATPASQNPVHLYARYRRGMADQQLGEHDKAMFELMHVIKGARSHPQRACSELLVEASLKAMITSARAYVAAEKHNAAVSMLNAMLGRYEPLRTQCPAIASIIAAIRSQHQAAVSLEALAARHEERCGDKP